MRELYAWEEVYIGVRVRVCVSVSERGVNFPRGE